MDYQELLIHEINATATQYWKTIDIWLNNPHLVNRRISSSVTILQAHLTADVPGFLKSILNNSVDKLLIASELSTLTPLKDIDPFKNTEGTFVLVKKLLPRDDNNYSSTVEFSIIEKVKMSVICVSRGLNEEKRSLGFPLPYKIEFRGKNLAISLKKSENLDDWSVRWLTDKLFPRLIKWIESEHRRSIVGGSLNLICCEKYTNLYNSLKKKYGRELVQRWPECTDPVKFVYEDIAIAAYLILLWEDERKREAIEKKQSFLDLGCGNGLLVYILMSEGHPGMGIDLRKRKIWELFSEVPLEERTIIPSSKSLFPAIDWLIGNHSDELTPWIPVIAARSSYNCRFFLLPCCAHEFDGRKFQRESASSSQYSEYLKYIKTVCETCGFVTELDRLRIPSTKRVCLIGRRRNYSEDKSGIQDDKIEKLINARSLKSKNSNEQNEETSDTWAPDFKPRNLVERVRNCTQIDKNVVSEIVNLVSSELLRKNRNITPINCERTWNAGGQIQLSEIAKIVPTESLKLLKNECGGLQTLFRNNSHIFQVTSGAVQFKIPGFVPKSQRKKASGKQIKFKVKQCWFFDNHPDGCPLSDADCNFKHEIK